MSRAIASLGAALLSSASGFYDTVRLALLAGTLVLAPGFCSAAALSRRAVQPA